MKIVPMSVQYVDHMGSDLSVVNAARVSFDKESNWEEFFSCQPDKEDNIPSYKLQEKDEKLIKYLAEHNHWSPFAHAFISLRIKIPVFVARQAAKHQVGLSWNEVSRRYVNSKPEFWFPKEWRGKPVNAKQGSSGVIDMNWFDFEGVSNIALQAYLELLSRGVAPEQARMILPQNTMTEFIWSGSLYAFARVCNLRMTEYAQQEIKEMATMISEVIEPLFPISWKYLVSTN